MRAHNTFDPGSGELTIDVNLRGCEDPDVWIVDRGDDATLHLVAGKQELRIHGPLKTLRALARVASSAPTTEGT